MPLSSVPVEAIVALPFETALADHEFVKVGSLLVPECFKVLWIISASAFFHDLQSHTEVVTWPDTISSVVDITSNSVECTVSDVGVCGCRGHPSKCSLSSHAVLNILSANHPIPYRL